MRSRHTITKNLKERGLRTHL